MSTTTLNKILKTNLHLLKKVDRLEKAVVAAGVVEVTGAKIPRYTPRTKKPIQTIADAHAYIDERTKKRKARV